MQEQVAEMEGKEQLARDLAFALSIHESRISVVSMDGPKMVVEISAPHVLTYGIHASKQTTLKFDVDMLMQATTTSAFIPRRAGVLQLHILALARHSPLYR